MVLVRAPAGSGKTTLLAAWAAEARVPVAWLRIDAGDVDADILATALHTADVPAFVLALDDLHALGPGAASLLALLVDVLPPHVRVLAASRSAAVLPVARLRVRGELGELGAADLRLGLEALLLTLLLAKGERAAVLAAVDAASEAKASSAVYERWWPAYTYAALRAASPGRDARALRTLTARYLPTETRDASPTDAIVRGLVEARLAIATGTAPDGRESLATLAAAEEVQTAARAWLCHGLPGLERGSLLLEAGRATAALDAAEATVKTHMTRLLGKLGATSRTHAVARARELYLL